MNLADALDIANKIKKTDLPLKSKWQSAFLECSLHLRGYQPSFERLSVKGERRGKVEPTNWGGEDYDIYFNDVLFSRHPRENIATRQWRLSQYRPLSKEPLDRIVELIQGSIFADSQYQISLPSQDDFEYIDGNNFDKNTLVGYVSKNIPSIVEDANGYFVCIPKFSKLDAPAGAIDVQIWFVNSCDIYHVSEDYFLFKKGKSFWYLDKESIYKIEGETVYTASDSYYTHLMGRLPIAAAGGIFNTEGYYNSFLAKAIPVCNEFVSVYSASQMIDKEASHPYIIIGKEDCPTCQATGKVTQACNECPGGIEIKTCGTCEGRGTISYNPADRYEVPTEMLSQDFVKIINPDIAINDYHAKRVEGLYNRILDSLNLAFIDEAQSGAAKAIDQEKLYHFLSKISTHIFDNVISLLLDSIIMYRNIKKEGGQIVPDLYEYSIVKPSQFSIKTSQDLLLEIGDANKSGLPSFVRRQMLTEFADKRFGGDLTFQKKAMVIPSIDDLCVYSIEEKMTMVASGEATLQDVLFSRKLPNIIDKLIRQKGAEWFMNAGIEEIETLANESYRVSSEARQICQFNGAAAN